MDENIKNYIDQQIKTHIHDGNFSTQVQAMWIFNDYKYIQYRIVAPTTDTTVANVVGGDYVMQFSGSIYEIGATVDTAGTTNTTTIDVNNNGSTIMSTKITIDSGEKTSRTAATPPVISLPNFKVGDILTFDVDTVSTTAAKGLTMFMTVIETNNT